VLIPLKFKYRDPHLASSNMGPGSKSNNKGSSRPKKVATLMAELFRKKYGGKK
jgi:hypothetical protein